LKGGDGDGDFLVFDYLFEQTALAVPASALSQDEAAMTLRIFSDTRNAKGEFDLVNGFCNIFP